MNVPMVNYSGAAQQIGNSIYEGFAHLDEMAAARQLEKQMENFNEFKVNVANEIGETMNGKYSQKQIESTKNMIINIQDKEEFVAKTKEYYDQLQHFEQNQGAIKQLPTFGIKADTYKEQTAGQIQKHASQAALYGASPDSSQFGGRVATGPRSGISYGLEGTEGQGGYEDALESLMRAPSPYEQEMEQRYDADPFTALQGGMEEKQAKESNAINLPDAPELWKSLQLLPREQRRIAVNKLQNDDNNYNEADALKEVKNFIKAQRELKEEIAKERRTEGTKESAHKRLVGDTAYKAREGELPTRSRLSQQEQYTQNLFSGNIEVVDETGKVVDIEPNKAMDLGYSIRRRKPNVSVSVGAGRGGGSRSKDTQDFMRELNKVDTRIAYLMKIKGDPEAMLMEQLTPEQVDSELDVLTRKRIEYKDLVNQAAQKQGYSVQEDSKRDQIISALKQKGWDDAKIQRYLTSRGL